MFFFIHIPQNINKIKMKRHLLTRDGCGTDRQTLTLFISHFVTRRSENSIYLFIILKCQCQIFL